MLVTHLPFNCLWSLLQLRSKHVPASWYTTANIPISQWFATDLHYIHKYQLNTLRSKHFYLSMVHWWPVLHSQVSLTAQCKGIPGIPYLVYLVSISYLYTVEPLLKDTSEIRTPWLIRTLDWVPALYKWLLYSPWKKDTSLIRTWSQGCPY